MNITKPLLLLTACAALLPLQTFAQTLTDTITIEGRLTSLSNSFQGDAQLDPEATFLATIEVDRQAPADFIGPSIHQFSDAVVSASIELYDGQGMLIETPIVTRCDETTLVSSGPSSHAYTYFSDGQADSSAYLIWGGDMNGRNLECYPELTAMAAPLFASGTSFPVPLAGEYEALFSMMILNGDIERGISMNIGGVAENITVVSVDTDGDGVPDFADMCSSETSETVVFQGWYDSGVTNYSDSSGCTIMDHYAACEVVEEPVRGIRSVRRGPSSCEKAVSYEMVEQGIIDYAEARLLRSALYESYQDQPM